MKSILAPGFALSLVALLACKGGGGSAGGPQTPTGYVIVMQNVLDLASQQSGVAQLSCPSGTFIAGGGLSAGAPETDIIDSYPLTDGSGWKGNAKNYSILVPASWGVTATVVCTGPLAGYEVVSAPVVTVDVGQETRDQALCPAGKQVLGGGVMADNQWPKVIESSPKSDGTGWTVVVHRDPLSHYSSGSPPPPTRIRTIATCASPVAGLEVVTQSTKTVQPNSIAGLRVDCSNSNKRVLSGGYITTDASAVVFASEPTSLGGGGWTGKVQNSNLIATTVTAAAVAVCSL